ncbi:MAG: hypothetical protein Kow00109_18740 [Acidobacteriota bacterium]
METNLESILTRSVVRTFEELAFLLVDEELDPVQADAEPAAAARVCFAGPHRGELILCVYGPTVLAAAAQNMLGEFEAPSREVQMDAMKELANVVCGNLLPLWAGEEAVFDLTPPEAVEVQDWERADDVMAKVRLGIEAGRVEAFLKVVS